MQRLRAPWWMYLVAATFVADFLLRAFCFVLGPEWFGFAAQTEGERQIVAFVASGSAAERAGIKPGDVILALDGQTIQRDSDWGVIAPNLEIGRSYHFEIERGGRRLELTIPIEGVKSPDRQTHVIWHAAGLILLSTALLIAFHRPFDLVARKGALALATLSVSLYFTNLPPGYAAIWRELPRVVGALLWIPNVCVFLFGPICLTFFVVFPRALFGARWPWAIIWLPALCFVPANFYSAFLIVYRPTQAYGRILPTWVVGAELALFAVYGLASFAALAANYLRLTDPNEKRRLRVLFVGGGAGVLPGLLRLLIWGLAPRSAIVDFLTSRGPDAFIALIFVLFPVSFAYSILRHRLFDVGVLIRQGLQYALARGALVSLVPVLAMVMLGDILLHGERPLREILRARGWVYAALGALALLAHARRGQWLQALDRRFFREHYDAQRLLREMVEEVRQAGNFEGVAPRVVARIEASLHPEFVAVLVRGPREPSYHSLAAAPAGQAPPALPADSKLLALMRLLGKPLEVSLTESGWLKQQLPHEETDYLRQAHIDLLVPISSAPERSEALLALGVKRSEEPYSREDQDLLMAIAASLALLLEKPAAAQARPGEALEECPKCGTCYDTGAGRCAQEGASLIPMRLPRTLAGRYRLERRRGRGGMGAVYEATDTALERHVAVKVIRDDLVGSADAAERFRREARAAASFSHPNVVTVYDFGVEADTRAFLVMELLEGLTLREELKRQRRLEPARTVAILRGVCEAVEAAHRRQLVHRDLKPDNIFLARAETGEIPKVLDFGIAKFLPAATQATADTGTGPLVGTIAYMSPEQWLGQPVDAARDLWALAIVAYEMLTGAQPFTGATAAEWQSSVLAGKFTPLARYLPEAPARCQEFFARAFAADPADRPTSARTLFSELERAWS